MARNLRTYISGKMYEVCFRTQDGLPLVCTPYVEAILKGIIASAFSGYEIELVTLVVMGNHIHMHIRVINPEHVDDVIAYVKRESAHAINNLLGRRRRTVWEESFDAVIILDLDKMLERLAYLYLNPARAGLERIEKYPGLNTWQALRQGKPITFTGRRIPRESIPQLPDHTMSLAAQAQFADDLLEQALSEVGFELDPLGFFQAFPEAAFADREQIRQQIIQIVETSEAEIILRRKKPLLGAHALRLSSMRMSFVSKKFGKRMWCFGSTKDVRVSYINWMKERLNLREKLKGLMPFHKFLQNLPPGFFAPGGSIRSNVIPSFCRF